MTEEEMDKLCMERVYANLPQELKQFSRMIKSNETTKQLEMLDEEVRLGNEFESDIRANHRALKISAITRKEDTENGTIMENLEESDMYRRTTQMQEELKTAVNGKNMAQEQLGKVRRTCNKALDDARVYKHKFEQLECQYNSQNSELQQELRQTRAELDVKDDVIKTMTTLMKRSKQDIAASDDDIKKKRAELEDKHRQLCTIEAGNTRNTMELNEQNHLNFRLAEEIKDKGEELRRKEDEIIHWKNRMNSSEEQQRHMEIEYEHTIKSFMKEIDIQSQELTETRLTIEELRGRVKETHLEREIVPVDLESDDIKSLKAKIVSLTVKLEEKTKSNNGEEEDSGIESDVDDGSTQADDDEDKYRSVVSKGGRSDEESDMYELKLNEMKRSEKRSKASAEKGPWTAMDDKESDPYIGIVRIYKVEKKEPVNRVKVWNGHERRQWILALFTGCTILYACCGIFPMSSLITGRKFEWNSKAIGSVLCVFLWDYRTTKFLGEYLRNLIGGEHLLEKNFKKENKCRVVVLS
jgi:hypothetical protein